MEKTYAVHERGQVLLVVVLLMVVVLTIGLSLATRNITNLRQASEDDSSQRAFSAAEAGLQVALESNTTIPETDFSGSTYEAQVRTVQSHEFVIQDGRPIAANESVDIWLADYPAYTSKWNRPLIIAWGNPGETEPCQSAALVIAVLSGQNTASPSIQQYAFDPCSRGNSFSTPSEVIGPYRVAGKDFHYRATIPAITNGIIARVMPVYASTSFAVTSGNPANRLPIQGRIIESTGKSGDTQRKIVVVQGNPKLPLEIFPYVLFTP